ncbi:hypothetical protein V5O48_013709 [Marasmius crinis-equi]|uniref:Cytochrome P450 n=1 Tax=Marasmius crinis-equi TaxID=585013 RepID=A0ABR3EZP8_9AGAR
MTVMHVRLWNFEGIMDLNFSTRVGVALLLIFTGYKYYNARRERSKLDTIPTLGPGGIFFSYLTVCRYIFDVRALIDEGIEKYGDNPFKIPTPGGWQVVVNGEQKYDEMRRAPDDTLSSMEAIEDVSPQPVVTWKSANHFTWAVDWVEYSDTVGLLQKIITGVSNRYFVGLPLCRNDDWVALNINLVLSVALNSVMINLFPEVLHPIAGRIFTKRHSSLRRAVKHLAPIVEERLEMEKQYGPRVEWPGKPNDLISWLLDEGALNGEDWQKGSIEDIALRIITVNFVSIHTTSAAASQALYRLAANPHVANALREEINTVLEDEGGWTKTAVMKMHLLDSYLKESSRMGMVGAVGMQRKALKDFRFSDGTFVPAGSKVAMAAHSIHRTEDSYPSPHTFQPSRYSDQGDTLKNHMTTPSWGWLAFGAGKHACPGRFFAVNELKALLAHIVLNYDVKFASDNAKFPEPLCVATTFLPNNKGKVLFRKRRI